MTGDQWGNVPDPVLRSGTRLIEWCYDRGIRPPTLLEIEEERVRRGMRKGLHRA